MIICLQTILQITHINQLLVAEIHSIPTKVVVGMLWT
jgi:hypothetical protein